MTIRELARVALDVRRAIERSSLYRLANAMGRFPVGCCKPSSQILARYLVTELQVPLVSFVHAKRNGSSNGSWQSHVWLRIDQNNIDITADQYPEIDSPVVVSNGDGWHMGWERKRPLAYSEMMKFNRWEALRFELMYRAVCRAMKSPHQLRMRVPHRKATPPPD